MATDLNLDTKVTALKNARNAGEWVDALLDLLDSGLHSARNPFGAAAKLEESGSVPSGFVAQFAGATLPTGWLLCNGASYSRTAKADLFAAIGTTYGGSGSNFNVPDLRRRVPIGRGGTKPTGSRGPGASLGDTGGDERVTLTLAQLAQHSHDLNVSSQTSDGEHTHTYPAPRVFQGSGFSRTYGAVRNLNTSNKATGSDGGHSHRMSGASGDAGAASPTPINLFGKTLVINYMIKE